MDAYNEGSTEGACEVCGQREFSWRDGLFCCDECGTTLQRPYQPNEDPELYHGSAKKKRKTGSNKLELTSWECYNYILKGFVEDLISMGIKQEFKVMTLQVWAAYLRRTEAAFFNKNHVDLPKLGSRFWDRDSLALYNYRRRQPKKKKRKNDRVGLGTLAKQGKGRNWNFDKRKLDSSLYNQSMASSKEDSDLYSDISSGTTAHAVRVHFTALARKQYKKIMPAGHLKKHEIDHEGAMDCHKLRPNVRSLKYFDYAVTHLSIKQVYTIIGLALNLVGDEMQLCDLARFISEERIGTRNILQHFPHDLLPQCHEFLKDIHFFSHANKYTYRSLRDQIGLLSRFLNIADFKVPNMCKLVARYVHDLHLPKEIITYIERLINLLPPKMKMRSLYIYPPYEARAMAYILFVLKLLFGLDGHKEKLISESALEINAMIDVLKGTSAGPPLLFVWTEWVEYIEMRKTIISQYNHNYCRQFDQCQSTSQLLAQLDNDRKRDKCDEDLKAKRKENNYRDRVEKMKMIFDNFQTKYNKSEPEKSDVIFFTPSYTPSASYFQQILMHHSNADDGNRSSIVVPEFMRCDHKERTVEPYLQSRPLRHFFRSHGIQLNVTRERCPEDRHYVGIFRPHVEKSTFILQADFGIKEEEWLESVKDKLCPEELEFKEQLDDYKRKSLKLTRADALKQKRAKASVEISKSKTINKIQANDFLLPTTEFTKKLKQRDKDTEIDVKPCPSFHVFNEDDMEPIESVCLHEPRRRFDGAPLLNDVSNDELSEAEDTSEASRALTLVTSDLDYWTLLGFMSTLIDAHKQKLEDKFPRSFFWLLETCAQVIGVDWSLVYEQLLAIEVMFGYGVEPLNEINECVKFQDEIHIKDINHLVAVYREIW